MEEVVGIVTETSTESKVNKRTGRPFSVHYVKANTFSAPINVGYKQPYSVGDGVRLTVEQKYGEWKVVGPAATTTGSGGGGATVGTSATDGALSGSATRVYPPKPYTPASGGRNAVFPVPVTHGDYSICRQNALTNAVNLYTKITALPFPVMETAMEDVIKIAYKFAEFTSGQREVRIAHLEGAKAVVSE